VARIENFLVFIVTNNKIGFKISPKRCIGFLGVGRNK
jgi:hypothetical protein